MSRTRILVVEDHDLIANMIGQRLESLGFEPVAQTARGEEAIELAERLHPDLVLMDIRLAGEMDGITAAQAIGERLAIPVVFLTACEGGELLERAKATAPFGYVVKPFSDRELQIAIEMALYRHQAETRLRTSHQELAAILRTAMDGFLIADCDGRFLEVNEAYCQLTGYGREELLRMAVGDLEADESPAQTAAMIERIQKLGCARLERRNRRKDGQLIHLEISANYLPADGGRLICFVRDTTERQITESEREITIEVFRLISQRNNRHELMKAVTALLHEWSGCEAVGIRLSDGNDFPYFETRGFPAEFVQAENRLCEVDARGEVTRDSDGNPVLECMCGNVIRGRFDPAKPWFSANGSFWTNSTTELLASTTEADRLGRTRNRCNGEGFESVALIPLRAAGQVFGLLQLNDRRRGRFTPRLISLLESLANSVAIGLAHRLAEESLRESEEHFRSLVAGLPDIVMRFDRQGRHLFVSENVAKVVDLPACRFKGHTHRDLGFPEGHCRFWEEAIRAVYDSGKAFETEFTFQGKGGSTVFDWRLIPEVGSGNEVRSVLSISRDVTEHYQLRQQYRMLFHEMLNGFALHEMIYDAQGRAVDYRFLAVNPAFERLTGLKAEDIQGKTLLEVLPGSEPRWIEAYARVVSTGQPVFFEEYAAELGKHFEVSAFRPAPNQFACVFADATERKRSQEALQESEERFRLTFDQSPIGAALVSFDHRYLRVNEALCRITGYTSQELIQRGFPDITHPDDLAKDVALAQRLASGQIDHFEMDKRYVRKDGRIVWGHLNGRIMKGASGQPLCLLGTVEDITERKEAEEKLGALHVHLTHASRLAAVGELAAGIAHELNQPLCAIINFAKACKNLASDDSPDLPQIRGWSEAIAKAASQSGDIVRRMLLFARRGNATRQAVDVGQLVDDAMLLVGHEGAAREVVFRREIPQHLTVHVDPAQIQQVLVNLLRNGVEAFAGAGPGDRQVTVRARSAHAHVHVSISDNAGGQPAAGLPRFFEPFFTTKPTGLGLGLPISKTIIEDHGGRIWATANSGAGVSIHFTLPRERENPEDVSE